MTVLSRSTPDTAAGAGPAAGTSLAWQRTDTVGTEIVLGGGPGGPVRAEAVVAGVPAYGMHWSADVAADGTVGELTVTCRGAGWARELWLRRGAEGWSCHTQQDGHLDAPPAGIDADRLDPDAVLRVAQSPTFVTWALRHLRLTPQDGPRAAPTVRVLIPSLAVLPGRSAYHLLSPTRLRISGDEPGATYELDGAGTVTYQPGRWRLVH